MRAKAVNWVFLAAGAGTAALASAIVLAAPEPTVPPPLAHGPIATYDDACARCHGPNGSFYGPTLGKGKTDSELRQVIKDMAEGPSQLPPLPQRELDAQTAYHRALIKAEPFLAITLCSETRLEGEVTSGATVMVTTGGKTAAAKVKNSRWSAALLAKHETPIITARIGNVMTTLDTARAAFSHVTPLTAEDTKSTTGQATK